MHISVNNEMVLKQNLKNSEAIISNNNPKPNFNDVPEPRVTLTKQFDNTVKMRTGGSMMMPMFRAPTEIGHKSSIFNPATNYEIEKSEHMDMSLGS